MRRTAVFILILFMFSAFTGCQPGLAPLDNPAPGPMPLTGTDASRLGAAALMVEEQDGLDLDHFAIVPISAETGEPVAEAQPIELGGEIAYGFSLDRAQMAFLSNRTEGCEKYCLRVMDLRVWEELVKPIAVEKGFSSWFLVPEFYSDNPVIPLIINRQTDTLSEVMLINRSQGAVTARVDLPATALQAAVTPTGDVAVYGIQSLPDGSGARAYVALLGGSDLRTLWEQGVPEILFFEGAGPYHTDPVQGKYYEPAAVFVSNGDRLYLVAASEPRLLTVDFVQQSIKSARIQPRTGWLERIFGAKPVHAKSMNGISKSGVVSRDGRYLYIVGQETRVSQNARGEYETERIPLGLQVIDTQDATLLRTFDTDASLVRLSPDGKTLILCGWKDDANGGHEWTELLDAASWKITQRLDGYTWPSRLLDGSTALLVVPPANGVPNRFQLYRPGDLVPGMEITHARYIDWIVIP